MNGNAITIEELDKLIKEAQESGDWSKVENADVSQIKDMSSLFFRNKGIESLDLSRWDTSNVTNMSYMFSGTDFNSSLSFDTSKVTNMEGMFEDSKYNHPLHFDTSKVKTVASMFCMSKYNNPLYFDTSNVENMAAMFAHSDYNHPLNFDTSNVIDMDHMFVRSKFNQPLNFDLSNVTNTSSMFKNSKFNQDISDWIIQDTEDNKDIIKYRDECTIKRKEREVIEASIENNKSKISSCELKL